MTTFRVRYSRVDPDLWTVVQRSGQVIATHTTFEEAVIHARILNYPIPVLTRDPFDSQLDYPERHTGWQE